MFTLHLIFFAQFSMTDVLTFLRDIVQFVLDWLFGTLFSITFTSTLGRFFLSYFIKFRILMLEKGGVSCAHYFSCFTFMVEAIT